MSNTVLGLHPLITSITINGVVKTPDGSGNITVASGDVASIFKFDKAYGKGGPIWLVQPPTDPTT